MAYGGTPDVGMAPKKNGSHIKSAQMTRSKCLRYISQWPPWAIIRHYRVLPWAAGPLTSLESIAKVPDRQVAKTGKSSTDFLLSSVSVTVSQASTITAEAITIQTRKNGINHWVLHSLLIVILALELFFSDSQALWCQYLVLYAILLEWHYS